MTLVILDRDGVINEDSATFIKSAAEWIPLPGSIEAIARLSQAGFTLVVATNQSGLGRGYFERADLDAMHDKLHTLVGEAGGTIAGIYFCPHKPEDSCTCRKPAPGLFDAIRADFAHDLSGVAVIGDSLRDLEAGIARGCQPILVRTGKGRQSETALANASYKNQTLVFDDLAAAADFLIQREHP